MISIEFFFQTQTELVIWQICLIFPAKLGKFFSKFAKFSSKIKIPLNVSKFTI